MPTLFAVFLLLCAFSLNVCAMDVCQGYLGTNWREHSDRTVATLAKRFAGKIPGKNVIITCTGFDSPATIGRTVRDTNAPRTIFVVGIDSRFRTFEEGKHLRAVLAHEFAHYSNEEAASCSSYDNMWQRSVLLRCEHEVDVIAARWTSKRSTLAGLRATIKFLTQDQEAHGVAVDTTLLEDRIELLGH